MCDLKWKKSWRTLSLRPCQLGVLERRVISVCYMIQRPKCPCGSIDTCSPQIEGAHFRAGSVRYTLYMPVEAHHIVRPHTAALLELYRIELYHKRVSDKVR